MTKYFKKSPFLESFRKLYDRTGMFWTLEIDRNLECSLAGVLFYKLHILDPC
jgi:hypothetical protein